jgi:hypothetical protein
LLKPTKNQSKHHLFGQTHLKNKAKTTFLAKTYKKQSKNHLVDQKQQKT